MKAKLALIVLAGQSMVSLYTFGGEADDSWQNLSHVTRERYYTVVTGSRIAVQGISLPRMIMRLLSNCPMQPLSLSTGATCFV